MHEVSNPVFWKNNKISSVRHLLKFAQRVIKVKLLSTWRIPEVRQAMKKVDVISYMNSEDQDRTAHSDLNFHCTHCQ